MGSTKTKKVIYGLLLLLGVFLLYFLLKDLDFNLLFTSIKSLSLFQFGVIILLILVGLWLRIYRWKFLVQEVTQRKISWGYSVYTFLTGFALGSFTPGRFGEASKSAMMKVDGQISFAKTISIVIGERIFDFFALAFSLLLSLMFLEVIPKKAKALVLVSLVVLTILLIFLPFFVSIFVKIISKMMSHFKVKKSKQDRIEKTAHNFLIYFDILKKRRIFLVTAITSLGSMFFEFLRIFYLFVQFKVPVSFSQATFAFSSSVLLGVASFIPGGIGITENSQLFLLERVSSIALNSQLVVSAIIIDRFLTYYLLTGVGIIVLMIFSRKKSTSL